VLDPDCGVNSVTAIRTRRGCMCAARIAGTGPAGERGMANGEERGMSAFDEDLFEKGLEQRKATLGEAYVEKNLAAADDFTRPFQEAMTAWCWGFGWGDEAIDARTRSMMNLAMIGALGKMHEWEIHCRGALNNGVTKEEIRAIIHVVGIYCGVPQALECFRVARKVLEERGEI
jgi:4-carboxymuconolactone decarboxylase